MKIALIAPHIFMLPEFEGKVIFSPKYLFLDLANGLKKLGNEVTIFTPENCDLTLLNDELKLRGYGLNELLKKHPLTFTTIARQIQSELIAEVYSRSEEFDVIHIYMNEEELGYVFEKFSKCPVVFTHSDPFNFLVKYRTLMPKYKNLNWISMSMAQRSGMPNDTNWVGNIYHGIKPVNSQTRKPENYFAYFGRIVEQKGVHLAIEAVKKYNETHSKKVKLKIAGKHYADSEKEKYWNRIIKPQLNEEIEYIGFLSNEKEKNEFLGNAKALVVPSIFNEPFGMVMIEALRVGTPIIGLNNGAIPEVINSKNGILVNKENAVENLVLALDEVEKIKREDCRADFLERFTLERMVKEHEEVYKNLVSLRDNDIIL